MKKRLPRGAGILLPLSALPGPFGIGTLGDDAVAFVDFLKAAGQRYWQILPPGPTGYGDSPYQSFSAFAGNPYFIDPLLLHREGLLTTDEVAAAHTAAGPVDYGHLFATRAPLLRLAFSRFCPTDAYRAFCRREAAWLEDYALFYALKEHFGGRPFWEWPTPIRRRDPHAVRRYRDERRHDMEFVRFCQYAFFTQWQALRRYANRHRIRIIGDMPLYVAPDSADVWAHPELFQLDDAGNPTAVAGVPPDAFSAEGQRWGNPLYRWEEMERDSFGWWTRRLTAAAALYDAVRVDHFIGLARYYAIPADRPTAADGRFMEGPGRPFVQKMREVTDRVGLCLIAEDLGIDYPPAQKLLKLSGAPGMSVLQFAFDGNPQNPHLPHNFPRNRVVYGGTHDNDTLVGFCESAGRREMRYMMRYLGVKRRVAVPEALLRAAYASVADVAIFQMQDLLALGSDARMNTPSTVGNNWKWRLPTLQGLELPAARLRELARLYNR